MAPVSLRVSPRGDISPSKLGANSPFNAVLERFPRTQVKVRRDTRCGNLLLSIFLTVEVSVRGDKVKVCTVGPPVSPNCCIRKPAPLVWVIAPSEPLLRLEEKHDSQPVTVGMGAWGRRPWPQVLWVSHRGKNVRGKHPTTRSDPRLAGLSGVTFLQERGMTPDRGARHGLSQIPSFPAGPSCFTFNSMS